MVETTRNAIDVAVSTWTYIRSLTYDFLEKVPESSLRKDLPRPALDQVGKHLLELGDVTMAYAKGLETGEIDFGSIRWEFDESDLSSKKKIREHLEESDQILDSALGQAKDNPSRKYKLGDEDLTLLEIITWLSLHEVLHHGQLVAYGYFLHIEFPATWTEQWALPQA